MKVKSNYLERLIKESMMSGNKPIRESVTSGDIESGRPTLVSLTRKTLNRVYHELAGVQPTKSQIATVFGVRYEYVNNDETDAVDLHVDNRNYGGQYHMDSEVAGPNSNMAKSDIFKVDGYVYQVIEAGDYTSLSTKELTEKVLTGKLRLVTDSIEVHGQESDENIQKLRFVINQWRANVRSRRLRSDISIEMIQDMAAMGLDGDRAIEDLLSVAISEEINSDIINKLITVALKEQAYEPYQKDVSDYYVGRDIIAKALRMAGKIQAETTFTPTYLLASVEVAALVRASGQVDENDMIVGTNMRLMTDTKTQGHYMLVGVKEKFEEGDDGRGLDTVSAVYLSPFMEEDLGGTFMVSTDTESLQPAIGIITRYALSSAPLFDEITKPSKTHNGEDWVESANKCPFARMCVVNLGDR